MGAILAKLTSSEPAVLSIKARILAAEKRFDEAEQTLSAFSGAEQLSALAIIRTMRSRSTDALAACEAALLLPDLKDGCIFRAKLDTQSTANWTPVPRQTGH